MPYKLDGDMKFLRNNNDYGFTMMELMVAMTVIAIMSAISIPAITQAIPNYRLRSFAYDFLSTLQWGRGIAIKENQSVRIDLDSSGYTVRTDSDGDGDIDSDDTSLQSTVFGSYGNTTTNTGDASEDWEGNAMTQASFVTFNGQGRSNSGTFYFDNGESGSQNQLCYGVRVLSTGFIQVRKYVPCATNDKNCWIE